MPEHIRRLADFSIQKALPESDPAERPIALNLNENPFGPSPLALQAIAAGLADIHRYPSPDPCHLEQEIAKFHGVEPEQVMVAAGVTALLGVIAQATLGPGSNALTSVCSFLVYKVATEASGGKLIEIESHDYGYDLEAIAAAIDENTRVVFIANPNNPTGSLLADDRLTRFLDALPDHVLAVLDEAYFDFAYGFAQQRGVRYRNSLDRVQEQRCVMVLRTFSKAHGLAGLRVGYGVGPRKVISLLRPLRPIFSLSSLALAAAARALRDREHVARAVTNNTDQAEVLATGMRRLGLVVPPTWTNFLYCELGHEAAVVAERLRVAGILVQPLAACGAPTAIRVSIGRPEENAKFLEVLAATLARPTAVEEQKPSACRG